MADEARVQASLIIRKTVNNIAVLDYASRPAAFTADVSGQKGPTPGAVTALTTGTIVNLGELVVPGFVRLASLDDDTDNYVEWGIYDPQTNVFYPLGELGAGEVCVFKFSRNLLEEYIGTGTGTTGPTNQFMVKAAAASADVLVEAFEA